PRKGNAFIMVIYTAALYAMVGKGLTANSYKFALWRALASLASGTDKKKPTISKQQLAPLFLSYYWPLEVKYHIRQGIDPNKDPIVMKRIRHLIGVGTIAHGETLKDFQRRMPTEHKMLVGSIARQALDDVMLPWRTTTTSHCSRRAWTPGTRGVMRTSTFTGCKKHHNPRTLRPAHARSAGRKRRTVTAPRQ